MKRTTLLAFLSLVLLTTGSTLAQWAQNGPDTVWTDDNVGVGTSTPGTDLHVVGGFSLESPSDSNIKLQTGHNSNGFFFMSPFDAGTNTWEDLWLNVGGTTDMGRVQLRDCLRFDEAGTGDADVDFCNDDSTFPASGVAMRILTNPPAGQPIFRVLSSGGAARLQVEHDGRLFTANTLHVAGTGDSIISGNLGIGTSTPQSKLAVNGTVTAREVVVTTTGWPDYVFESGYDLMSLSEVEAAIDELGHLPGIPSAAEVEAEGIGVGEMQAKLLEKVEELTLHLIDLEKENHRLHERVAQLEANDAAVER